MFSNYFKIAWRNLSKRFAFSLINTLGLSVGLACCMLILLYAKDEVSYDRFHANKVEIYRLVATSTTPKGEVNNLAVTGMVPGPAFKDNIPEIKAFVRIQGDGFAVKKGVDIFQQPVLNVDSNFFSVFSFPLKAGNPQTVLNDPYSIVLTEETAKKYFGTTEALGQQLQMKTDDSTFKPFTVTGITAAVPQNSSIKFDMLVPMSFRRLQGNDNSWINFYLNTFLLLPEGVKLQQVESKLAKVYATEASTQLKEAEEKYDLKEKIRFGLQPLLDIHLSKDYKAENGLTGASNPLYSYILSGIALFVFLIACINFVNLTIAGSLKRAKEVGVRKVVGSQRRQLVVQFLSESFLLTFISFLLAILLVNLLLPFFNIVSNKALAFSYLLDVKLISVFIAMFLLTGLLAGFYPAVVLSRFTPVETLYGKLRFGGRNYLLRGLIVVQFALATFLIIATVIVYSQFRYLTGFNLGYNDKNVAVIKAGRFDRYKYEIVKAELLHNPAILSISADQGGRWETVAHINGDVEATFNMKIIDENYLPMLQIPIVQGRNFLKGISSDTANGVLVNEAFVKMAGWRQPLGEVIDFFYHNKKYNVLGVVKDYHFAALNEAIKPQIFLSNPEYSLQDVYVKINPQKTAEILPFLQSIFKQLFPFQPYEYKFKDAENATQYEAEAKWKQIISFGAILTIFISCIGLLGLSMLAAEKRTKEIGIRKVLGASVATIVRTLSIAFLKLVLLAAVIAIPFAVWLSQRWLKNYPYRVTLNGWMFGGATVLILLVAAATISIQAVRAAVANPVKSLRTE